MGSGRLSLRDPHPRSVNILCNLVTPSKIFDGEPPCLRRPQPGKIRRDDTLQDKRTETRPTLKSLPPSKCKPRNRSRVTGREVSTDYVQTHGRMSLALSFGGPGQTPDVPTVQFHRVPNTYDRKRFRRTLLHSFLNQKEQTISL